jgi:hypothetical protein
MRRYPMLVMLVRAREYVNVWEYWSLQNEPSRNHNGNMHLVLVNMDSLGPSVYVVLGLVLIFGSRLVQRLAVEPTFQVADAGRRGGVEIRIRSKRVVPINRNTRVSQCVASPGNYF